MGLSPFVNAILMRKSLSFLVFILLGASMLSAQYVVLTPAGVDEAEAAPVGPCLRVGGGPARRRTPSSAIRLGRRGFPNAGIVDSTVIVLGRVDLSIILALAAASFRLVEVLLLHAT